MRYTQISANLHNLALGKDGYIYAWGWNGHGQLGDGSSTNRSLPVRVQTPEGVHFTQISAGSLHSLALGDDHNIYAWGSNYSGQLGTAANAGTQTPNPIPVKVTGGSLPADAITSISADNNYSMALDNQGHVHTWGDNKYGPLGNATNSGTNNPNPTPTQITSGSLASATITSISAGDEHALALDNQGRVHAWGSNTRGELGNTTNNGLHVPNPTPTPVTTGSLASATITSISAGGYFSTALDNQGHIHAWGYNAMGVLGNGSTDSTSANPTPSTITASSLNGSFITKISTSTYHVVALDNQGRVYAWGSNNNNQIGINNSNGNILSSPTLITTGSLADSGISITDIGAGAIHSVALDSQGVAYAWGSNVYSQLGDGNTGSLGSGRYTPQEVSGTKYVVNTASFGSNAVTSKTIDSTSGAWNMDVPKSGPGAVNVTVNYHLEGIDSGGHISSTNAGTGSLTFHYTYTAIYKVTFNLGGAPGTPPAAQAVFTDDLRPVNFPDPTPSWEHHWFIGWADSSGKLWDFSKTVNSNMTLTAKWEAWKFGMSSTGGPPYGGESVSITSPEPPQGLRYTQISGGSAHTLAIASDGNTYAWGSNGRGELGNGNNTDSNLPVRVHTPAGVHFTKIWADNWKSYALGDDNNAYSWGWNNSGILGDGTTIDRNEPVKVSPGELTPGTHFTELSIGLVHVMALANDHTIYTWGNNDGAGILGQGSLRGTRTTPGKIHQGELNPGTYYVQISASAYTCAALTNDHVVYTWGHNGWGQLGNGQQGAVSEPKKISQGELDPSTYYTRISCGGIHCLALANDNTLYAWGDDNNGRLGDGDPSRSNKFTPVKASRGELNPGTYFVDISSGWEFSAGVTNDNTLYTWGGNDYGQLGNGESGRANENHRLVPSKIEQGEHTQSNKYKTVIAGYYHTIAIDEDGNIYSWGCNSNGQLGNGSNGTGNTYPPNPAVDKTTPAKTGKQKLAVTSVAFDQTEANPAPVWDSAKKVWQLTVPAHPAGLVDAKIRWTLGSDPQDDYPLPYTYGMIMPKAGAFPTRRLAGRGILLATTLTALTLTTHHLTHPKRHPHPRHHPA
ncbi:hypothetical protein KIMH_01260 [Bombiscardovia apis]|uniref:RCC1-like domain-containing protein n=1 Tax=Bombiscardovia apis TaxID=2932182 RepID=A0ABN6SD57_9BIFI|nr:InlB B-repeat-containing protein [Bombiscardovia apis]BDR54015.1 hypothetical protein KIMH_01260 [Bombiscardovia apis]